MMEPIPMDVAISSIQNQMDDEKSTIQLLKKHWEGNVKTERQIEIIQRQQSSSSEDEQIPEIKDIYDQIYGNVKSKRVFYEGQKNNVTAEQKPSSNCSNNLIIENSKEDKLNHAKISETNSLATSDSLDYSSVGNDNLENPAQNENIDANFRVGSFNDATAFNSPTVVESLKDTQLEKKPFKVDSPPHSILVKNEVDVSADIKSTELFEATDFSETTTPVNSPFIDKKTFEQPQLFDAASNVGNSCHKCQKAEYVNDRSEVLTEINANLKLELENFKQQLKNEVAKNNQLNFEIANIEVALEMYYKEAKNQKSTLSSIYSAMKNYVSDQKDESQEHYTYKRIKMIADYMESLKNKLEHQDKIIKNNFIENPYYTDLIIKHEAVIRQLDEMSRVNQELQDEMKKKTAEEVDIIKELNRQKFQIENKCREMEEYYRNEIITKEALIRSVEDEYKKELEDFQTVLDQKDEEMAKTQKTAAARINNYKQELVVVYRKWKEQKMLNKASK